MNRILKICFGGCALLLLWCSGSSQVAATQQVDEDFYLFLLAGQSNMAGRGIPDSTSMVTDNRILMLDKNDRWIPAKDPLHFDKPEAGVGPGISFAKELLRQMPGKRITIGLIPAAVGGTSIDKWAPGACDSITATHPYDEAVRRTKYAMQKGVLKGILWHQGSADASLPKRVHYVDKLAILISRFRDEFDAPQLPFVAGELGNQTDNKKAFNVLLYQLLSKLEYVKIVSAEGLTTNPDNIHFDTPSARVLGKRYAIAIIEFMK
jgi:hypothetical protein